jgi:hypothetical protein
VEGAIVSKKPRPGEGARRGGYSGKEMEALLRKKYAEGKRLLEQPNRAGAKQSESTSTDVEGPSPASKSVHESERRRFARVYTSEELEELLRLRTKKQGTPLGWGIVLKLMAVENKNKRRKLELKAADKSWSVRDTATFLRENVFKKKRSKGARPLAQPKNLFELVHRLDVDVEKSRRHLAHWTESHLLNQSFSTTRFRRSFRARVQAIREELTILVRTAEDLSRKLEPIAAGAPGTRQGSSS